MLLGCAVLAVLSLSSVTPCKADRNHFLQPVVDMRRSFTQCLSDCLQLYHLQKALKKEGIKTFGGVRGADELNLERAPSDRYAVTLYILHLFSNLYGKLS